MDNPTFRERLARLGDITGLALPPTPLVCTTCDRNLADCACTIDDFLPRPLLLEHVPGTVIILRRRTDIPPELIDLYREPQWAKGV